MTNKTLQLETLSCPTCVRKIEGALKKTKGVQEVEVLFTSSRVKVAFDETVVGEADIQRTIEALGFDVLGIK